jgi:uncharacterized protein
MIRRFGTLFFLLALLLCSTAQAEVGIPKLTQRVTDLTATLDAAQIQALNARLAAFESGKGSQIAVLMLPSTQPETIDQYSIRVAESWKLGRKGVDDGVLLLIAKDDHRVRIEAGYGLEGALNDATSKRIVSEVITPYFKRGEYYPGIDAGVTAIIKVVEGEPLPPAQDTSAQSGSEADVPGQLLVTGFVIFMMGNILLRQMMGKLPSGLIVGGVIGVLTWVMMLSLAWAIATALAAFVFSLIFGLSGRGLYFPSGGGSGGGWGDGGGFGGGGFSGGGGGFGGGGASGGW